MPLCEVVVTNAWGNSESARSFGENERLAMAGLHTVCLLAIMLAGSPLRDFKQYEFLGFLLNFKMRVLAYR